MKNKIVILLVIISALTMILTGCGKKDDNDNNVTEGTESTEDINIEEIWNKIESETGTENLPAFSGGTSDEIRLLYNINPDDLESYILKSPMMITQATEIFIAHVKDGKMDDVKSGIEKRVKALEESLIDYLPAQYELVKNHKIETSGNYVIFVVSEEPDKIVTIFKDFMK